MPITPPAMHLTREEQFAFIASAKASVLASARSDGIPLHRIELVVPFVHDDFGLGVWFFYETDDQLQSAGAPVRPKP